MPLVSQVAHDRDTMLLQKYHTIVINLIPSGFWSCYSDIFEVAYVSLSCATRGTNFIRPIALQSHTKGNHLITQNG